ncbi:MAG: PLP-dependent transferase [Actinomycetia bacterium]|nr:PLP-dependent transferase [Actinomycetes bacterium]MCP4961737.1 PLP-dependent transferase [Actinomycetes bacterium]
MTDNLSTDTFVVNAGRSRIAGQPLNPPPVPASNFYLPHDRLYARSHGTETSDALEELIGGLDRGRSLVFSSGMAAAGVVLNRLPVGATLAIPTDPYHGVDGIASEGETLGRWNLLRLDLADTQAWIDAAATADLLWLESPANPLIDVADLPAICGAPRKPGTIVAVDSTFATPICQTPLDLGADVVMHSATKFLGGHSDLLAGSVTVAEDTLYDEFRERRMLNGATIGALEAFLTIRGIRTLGVRMERAQHNAQILAERLADHVEISIVRYPGIASHPTHEVAASFMTGFGAMMSFDTTGPGERANAVCRATRVVHHATSLGGVETTMERRANITGQETMPPTLIRMSVGIEDVEDLWSDLTQALESTVGMSHS